MILTFISQPGDASIEFDLSSAAINNVILGLQYGESFSQTPLTVNFRYCEPGEIIQGNV